MQTKETINEMLKKVSARLSDDAFLSNKGLSNEVGIHVFCYDPADELTVRSWFEFLKNKKDVPYRLIECDLYKIFLEICKERNIPLLIDCSQSAGHFEIDVKKLGASVVFPGHKGVFAPPGTGIMYLNSIMPKPLIFGGTGSDSGSILQPQILPDYYESGTLNMVGIAGLLKGVEFILNTGIEEIHKKEFALSKMLRDGLKNMKNINLCEENLEDYGSVISFTSPIAETSEIAYLLDKRYDIAVRSGLHCAPLAHKTYGTFPDGTVRLSPGFFNTTHEMQLTLDAINDIVNH